MPKTKISKKEFKEKVDFFHEKYGKSFVIELAKHFGVNKQTIYAKLDKLEIKEKYCAPRNSIIFED